jgi:hypothetical protein
METKDNAYAVLKLCLESTTYDHNDLDHDICGHIAQHMGVPRVSEDGIFRWSSFYNHIGFAEYEWQLWQLLNMDLTKEQALKKFAEMILFIHGRSDSGIPENLRLL